MVDGWMDYISLFPVAQEDLEEDMEVVEEVVEASAEEAFV